jgi:hypothetical protein
VQFPSLRNRIATERFQTVVNFVRFDTQSASECYERFYESIFFAETIVPFLRNQPDFISDRSQSNVGIILPQENPILGTRSEHTIRLVHPFGHQVVYQHPDVGFIACQYQLVEETLKQFVGEIQQVPPTYSAVKVNGDRSYALRRAGEEVQLKPKTVRVDEIELTDYNDEEKTASIRVVCGKGTYIRSLARDIGRALDSGAYLTALRRTKAGSFAVENCISFDHFQEWLDEQPLEDSLQPSK